MKQELKELDIQQTMRGIRDMCFNLVVWIFAWIYFQYTCEIHFAVQKKEDKKFKLRKAVYYSFIGLTCSTIVLFYLCLLLSPARDLEKAELDFTFVSNTLLIVLILVSIFNAFRFCRNHPFLKLNYKNNVILIFCFLLIFIVASLQYQVCITTEIDDRKALAII